MEQDPTNPSDADDALDQADQYDQAGVAGPPPDEPAKHTAGVAVSEQNVLRPGNGLPWAIAGLLAVVAVGLVVALLTVLRSSNERFDELAQAVTGLDEHVGEVGRRVDSLGAQVAASNAESLSPTPTATVPETTGIPGGLPLFESTQDDPAVANGIVLGSVTGTDYYTGDEATFSPDDGKARVWMVWAHWCPHCQAELPEVADWYSANAGIFPNTELVSVTTSIDPSRGNPLEPYLDESAFPFPVLVDPDYRLASQFGTSAFPYWVVTASDGTVLLRIAGRVGLAQVENIFTELESLTADA
jgi:thiol-disulfide isomerase/thioredoxin